MNKLSKTTYDELVKLGLEVKRKELEELELLISPITKVKKLTKVHWTQRPGGKAKMSRIMKRSWKNRK